MSCDSCSSAINQIIRDIKLLQKSVGSTITTTQLNQLIASVNNQIAAIQTEVNLINCSGDINSIIQQAAKQWITATTYNQFSAAVNNQLTLIQNEINRINCSGNFQNFIEQAAANWITTTTYNQFNAAVNNQLTLINQQLCNLQATVLLLEGEIEQFGVGKTYVSSEIPSGLINSVNTQFYVSHVPNPQNSLHLFANGLRIATSGDYTLFQNNITTAYPFPSGTNFLADYIY